MTELTEEQRINEAILEAITFVSPRLEHVLSEISKGIEGQLCFALVIACASEDQPCVPAITTNVPQENAVSLLETGIKGVQLGITPMGGLVQ